MTTKEAIEIASKLADSRPCPLANPAGFEIWTNAAMGMWNTCNDLTRDKYGNRVLDYTRWIRCAGYICCEPERYEAQAREVAHIY